MAMQMNNTKWTVAVLAAFALGVSVSALMSGTKTPASYNNIAAVEPASGDENLAANTVIADVNGTKLTMKDYNDYLRTMPEQVQAAPMDQVFGMVQDQLVVGTIISNRASGMESDPEVQKRMATLQQNVIRAAWLEREVKSKVTESAAKKEYDEYAKNFEPAEEMNAQHILVDSEAKAKDIIAKLQGGAKFEDMVKEYSKDKGAKNDGDLGYFKQTDMVKEFADVAYQMKKGETSKSPVKTQFGYHVIRVNDRRLSQVPTFEQMKPQIESKLQREALETVINDLRKSAKIELFDAKGEPVKTAAKEMAKEPSQAEPAAGEAAKPEEPKQAE